MVYGVHGNDVRKELLKKGDVLTVDDAIVIVRSAEAANQQAQTLRGHDTQIQFIKKSAYQRNKKEVHGGGKLKDSSRKTQAPKENPYTYDDNC